jgi:hypothetical protein
MAKQVEVNPADGSAPNGAAQHRLVEVAGADQVVHWESHVKGAKHSHVLWVYNTIDNTI